jgi:hypothetical protein
MAGRCVRVSIGYDCRYSTPDVIHADWCDKLQVAM